MIANVSTMASTGMKYNGHNYDDWIEYVKLNAGILGLDSALIMDEPAKPTDTSEESVREVWVEWERANRLLMSFLKLSIGSKCEAFPAQN